MSIAGPYSTRQYDERAVTQIMQRLELVLAKKQNLKEILDNYIGVIDADIAKTNTAVDAVVAARAAVDGDSTVNANLKAELRALENACLKLRDENRNYKRAFIWLRDHYSQT